LENRESERRQENRQAQVQQFRDGAKRWLRIVSKDFRRRFYRAPFFVEVIGLLVLSGYAWAAHHANQLTHEALQVTERAYVDVQNVERVNLGSFETARVAEALVLYKNSGLTPARQLTVDLLCGIAHEKPHEERHERMPPFVTQLFDAQQSCETKPQGEVLPPGVTRHKNTNVRKATGQPSMNEEFNCNFESDDHRDIKKGVAWWYVEASISYLDQFGNCHWTGETFIYNPETDEFDPLTSGFKQIDPQK
jgi:hypothetical protein